MLSVLQCWLGQNHTTSINSLKKDLCLLLLACCRRYGVKNSVEMFFDDRDNCFKTFEASNSSDDDYF
jgi:hypothetical protein